VKPISIDTFAMSNPALTSILIWQFAKSYAKEGASGPSLSLCFIVLPIVMSRPTMRSFDGTNVRTGFLTWLTRHPELTIQLPSQIGAARELTGDALRFGVAYRLFTVARDGTLVVNANAISVANQRLGQDERVRMLKIASHLGEWTQKLPEATVFYSLGLTP
jgi:Family of unknown function (DUF6521)